MGSTPDDHRVNGGTTPPTSAVGAWKKFWPAKGGGWSPGNGKEPRTVGGTPYGCGWPRGEGTCCDWLCGERGPVVEEGYPRGCGGGGGKGGSSRGALRGASWRRCSTGASTTKVVVEVAATSAVCAPGRALMSAICSRTRANERESFAECSCQWSQQARHAQSRRNGFLVPCRRTKKNTRQR
jgi:hypothetical protein